MSTDDLDKPLGVTKKKKKRLALPEGFMTRLFAGALSLLVAGIAGWIMFIDDPLGGEPIVIVSAATGASQAQKPTAAEASKPNTPAVAEAEKPASPTVTIIDGSTGKRQEIVVAPPGGRKTETKSEPKIDMKPEPKSGSGPGAAIDQRLLEPSRHGAIPKIAADGARPSEIYSRPVKALPGGLQLPRVAIVIEGLGISANGTTEALAKLPASVTFAFAPYGTDAERWVARARSEGHEVLMQVGMEPFDYPDNDPGPQTLLTSLAGERNVDRLQWFMSRFQGYVGVSNLMGARFAAMEQALSPVMREVGKRGLIYFDNGASPRSLAGQSAGANNVTFAKADTVLDVVPNANEIDVALARLEATARNRGVAIASASALPVTIDRVSQWARSAEERGIAIVPVSAVAKSAKSSS